MSYISHGEKVVKNLNYSNAHHTSPSQEYFSRFHYLLQIVKCLEKELLYRDDYFVDRDGDVSFQSGSLEVKAYDDIQTHKDLVESFNKIKGYLENKDSM